MNDFEPRDLILLLLFVFLLCAVLAFAAALGLKPPPISGP